MASPPSVSSPSSGPPFYVLVSHAALSNASSAFPTSPASLGHPIIQYHYADDSPLALLPQYAGERVLVLDYDPISTTPSAKSISDAVAVMGVKVTDAPGVGVADGGPGNTKMYLIETISIGEDRLTLGGTDHQDPQAILARFKQRNAVLRNALEHPDASKQLPIKSPRQPFPFLPSQ